MSHRLNVGWRRITLGVKTINVPDIEIYKRAHVGIIADGIGLVQGFDSVFIIKKGETIQISHPVQA